MFFISFLVILLLLVVQKTILLLLFLLLLFNVLFLVLSIYACSQTRSYVIELKSYRLGHVFGLAMFMVRTCQDIVIGHASNNHV